MTREEYLQGWQRLHGVAPTGIVVVWLRWTYLVARPLAGAGVAPTALTLAGLAVSVSLVPLVALGGRWPLLAAPLAVLSGLLDNLDGAVAVMTSRVTRWGGVLDSVTDRLSDVAYLVALWVLGAPGGVAAAAGVLVLLQEYVRARAAALGMSDVGVVTVAERPTRVIGTVMFCLAAGLLPAHATLWAGLGGAFFVLTGLVGTAQLLVVVRRRLA